MEKIFSYSDPAAFLRDKLEEKKRKNESFSLRAWAKQLGMKSHGPLHAILNGERAIPKKFIPLFIKNLELPEKDAKYFEAMVDYQRSKTEEEKKFYRKKLDALGVKPAREVDDIEAYKYITDPLHIMISELVELRDFTNNLGWIKKRLLLNPSMLEIEEVLARLVQLGILTPQDGKYKKEVRHIFTKKEMMNKAVQIYHKKVAQYAVDQIEKQDIASREFNAISFNVKKKDLEKMKLFIRDFINDLVQQYEAPPGEGEETYQLNVQFFALTGK